MTCVETLYHLTATAADTPLSGCRAPHHWGGMATPVAMYVTQGAFSKAFLQKPTQYIII